MKLTIEYCKVLKFNFMLIIVVCRYLQQIQPIIVYMLIIHTKSSNYTFRSLSLSFKLTFTCHSILLTYYLFKWLLQETWSFYTKYRYIYIPFELSKLHYPYYWCHLNKKMLLWNNNSHWHINRHWYVTIKPRINVNFISTPLLH